MIELEQFDRANSELNDLDSRFRVVSRTHDVRIGLRCKLLIRERKWRLAEQVLNEVKDRSTPQYRALRVDILEQKSLDPTASPGEREASLQELEALRTVGELNARLVGEPDATEAEDDADQRPEDEAQQ